MTFFRKMGVHQGAPSDAEDERWEDYRGTLGGREQGRSESPDTRSRLVGQVFNTVKNDELYASTALLEALRYVISSAATTMKNGVQRHVMVNDVRRAYFYAKTSRDIYIELPN